MSTLQQQIEKSFTSRARGELTDYDLAQLHQARAQELGKSLTEYYDSYEGARSLNHALKASHYEQQVENSCGDGFPGVDQVRDVHRTRKAFGNPADRQREFETPDVTRPSGAPTLNGGSIPWPVFDRAVELPMAARNCSRDEAISEIYRAEKRLKKNALAASNKPVNFGDGDDDKQAEVEEPWDKQVKALMAKHSVSYDAAASMLHKREKAAKGFQF